MFCPICSSLFTVRFSCGSVVIILLSFVTDVRFVLSSTICMQIISFSVTLVVDMTKGVVGF